ncbi:MAG: polymer-forming cytoskeletal protein [Spirochaetia bacterium]
MPDMRLKSIDESDIDTVLAGDIEFEGELSFEKPLLIKGKFKGSINASSDLYVSREAEVKAKINASVVSVKGRVKGDITATERLELFESSALKGNIKTSDLIMESGCMFNGTCAMPEHDGDQNSREKAGR